MQGEHRQFKEGLAGRAGKRSGVALLSYAGLATRGLWGTRQASKRQIGF